MEAAHGIAVELGAGAAGRELWYYRSIEAEYLTRMRSQTADVEPWLTLEWIEDELGGMRPKLAVEGSRACLETRDRLGFFDVPKLWVTFLSEESDAPWVPGRHGYCEAKIGFFKICLPAYLSDDARELGSAIAHESAHAFCMDAARGRLSPWVEEAVSMVMGREMDPRAERAFASGAWDWLPPRELAAAFVEDRESDDGRRIVHRAYQQSGLIGMEMARLGGETSLGEVARRVGRTGFWTELLARLRTAGPEEPAIRSTYGIGVRALFARTLKRLTG